jgi:hypothetical protein
MVSMRQRSLETGRALVLAAVALVLAQQSGVAGWASLDVLHGICRELLQGSTEGRQALVGSCWYGPLPILAGTLGAWLVPGPEALPWALLAVAWLGWAMALYRLGRLVHATLLIRLLVQLAAAASLVVCEGAWQPTVALPVWLGVQAASSCADWSVTRRMGALATLGFTLGALLLCGVTLCGWMVWVLACLALVTVFAPEVRRRLAAVLLLGALPLVYAVGVWSLMNWLLLGHPLFFVQSLAGAECLRWHGWPTAGGSAVNMLALGMAVGALVLAAYRRRPEGLVLGGLACGAWWWGGILTGCEAAWAAGTTLPLALWLGGAGIVCALRDAVPYLQAPEEDRGVREDVPPVAGVSGITIVIVAGVLLGVVLWAVQTELSQTTSAARWAATRQQTAQQAAVFQSVTAYVQARTPYGLVFVCGYEGLALLAQRPPESRLRPCMDLQIGENRRLYHGQHLFVLIRRPTGRSAVDSVHGRMSEAYWRGVPSTLLAHDFGAWRLFEVVGAPTDKQLREWRHPAPAVDATLPPPARSVP